MGTPNIEYDGDSKGCVKFTVVVQDGKYVRVTCEAHTGLLDRSSFKVYRQQVYNAPAVYNDIIWDPNSSC